MTVCQLKISLEACSITRFASRPITIFSLVEDLFLPLLHIGFGCGNEGHGG